MALMNWDKVIQDKERAELIYNSCVDYLKTHDIDKMKSFWRPSKAEFDAEYNCTFLPAEDPIEEKKKKVIRLLKGGFEEKFGMSFDDFIAVYNELIENEPQRLI